MSDPKQLYTKWIRRRKSTPTEPRPQDGNTPASTTPDVRPTSESAVASVLDSISLALDLAEQAVDIAQVAPFIAPAAALLRKIIESYKEMKATSGKRCALAERIGNISGDICATVLRMEATNHSDLIGRLKQDLNKYAALLEKASRFIQVYDDQGKFAHFAGRNHLSEELDVLNGELNSFEERFRTNRLVDLAINQTTDAQTLNKVYDIVVVKMLEEWLESPPDMKRKQHDTEQLRMEGTGRWFLQSDEFTEWQDNAGILWIESPSGSGKSVLSSTVIKQLFEAGELSMERGKARPPLAVAFFYFDFRNKLAQSVEIALRRIVLQLSAQSAQPYKALEAHHSFSSGQKLPTYKELQSIFYKLLRELGRTYIIIDALDECKDGDFDNLVALILSLRRWTETPLHLLFTSQTRPIFTKSFQGLSQISLQSDIPQEQDIKLFITTELQTNSNLEIWRPHAGRVVHGISRKSKGMFRLAACLLIELADCLVDDELEKTLETLPDDLFGVYDRFIQAIPPKHFPYATAALRWIIFSCGPAGSSGDWSSGDWSSGDSWSGGSISLITLADAVAFDFSDSGEFIYKPSRRNHLLAAIPKWLAGLIEENKRRLSVTLVHASVQDYLLSAHFKERFSCDLGESLSHTFISRICISYFLYFANHPLEESTVQNYPLVEYAANNWYHSHLVHSQDFNTLLPLTMQLLQDGSEQYRALVHICTDWHPEDPPLHFCCRQRYTECVAPLLANGASINLVGDEGTPLEMASSRGYMEIVHLCLENGADINVAGGSYGSALAAASHWGELEIVNLLLKSGANIDLAGGDYGSALIAASYGGALEVVRLLLDHGANVDLPGGQYGSAVAAASLVGRLDIVHLLLENGTNINLPGGSCGSALVAATYSGNEEIVSLLLKSGADVKSQGGRALKEAYQWGREDIVGLLRESGAVPDAEDSDSLEYPEKPPPTTYSFATF